MWTGIIALILLATYLIEFNFISAYKNKIEFSDDQAKSGFASYSATKVRTFKAGLRITNLAAAICCAYVTANEYNIYITFLTFIGIFVASETILRLSNIAKLPNEAIESVSRVFHLTAYPIARLFKNSEYEISTNRSYELNNCSTTTNEKAENEVEIFQNALDLSSLKLKNCIVPRTEITAIEVGSNVDELKKLFISTNYSRILVYKDNIDCIIGYVHSSDIFDKPSEISDILNPIIVVSEEMAANKLLKVLQKQKKSLALVVDEFGGTAGIITMEDLMEEIFGEIEDEYDNEDEYVQKKISNEEYLISGRLEVEETNEKFGLELPTSPDYETIAGLILTHHNILPKKGEIIKIGKNYSFEVIKVETTKIDLVKLRVSNAN
ncbi:MAG: HlyC/CorC family transporter [Paludibacteraceae bacterium]|nr:HlyC/CorC family transporter [Paludibacteraceae bacterium]